MKTKRLGLYVKLTEADQKMITELRNDRAINISRLVKNAIRKEHARKP